jgi:type I restriction enzyme S subunit
MNWKKVKLTDISKPKQWKNLPISELTLEGYAVYGANGIIGRYKEYNHEFPTLAITCRGATCGTINITEPKSYITSNAMALDDISEDVDQKFLYYALNKRGFKDVITGAAQPQITREGLTKIVLDIPESKDYQLHIANILSKAENLIAQRKESIRLLDEFLKSTFLEIFGDAVPMEKNWKEIQLQRISEIQGGLQVTSKREKNTIELPYLRVANVYRNSLDLSIIKTIKVTKEEAIRVRLEKDDILIVEGHGNPTEIGRSSIWDGSILNCLHQNHLIRVRVNLKLANPIYVNYFINSPSGRKQMFKAGKTTSGLNTISSKIVKEIVINLPPIELQTQFALIVEKTEALKSQYQQSLQELENLYGGLSQKAFRGELGVIQNQYSNQKVS